MEELRRKSCLYRLSGGDAYPYIKHHNPFAYFRDVRNSSTQAKKIVPLSRFMTNLSASGFAKSQLHSVEQSAEWTNLAR